MSLFTSNDFMPHGMCYQWRPDILWSHVFSDLTIAIAYFTIPVAILVFFYKRRDLKFQSVYVLFALFIAFCGISHLFNIYVVWTGAYGYHALIKMATAIVSAATAASCFKLLPKALKLPSPAQLNKEKSLRKYASFFERVTNLVPTGLMAIDNKFNIVMANPAVEDMFGYQNKELVGQNLGNLVDKKITNHNSWMESFFKNPDGFELSMAGGRAVQGVRKDGLPVNIEVSLAVQNIDSEYFAFINIANTDEKLEIKKQNEKLLYGSKRSIQAVKDGIWEWYIQSGTGWWNPQLADMIGLSADASYSFELWMNHINAPYLDKVQNAIDNALAGIKEFDVEYEGKGKNGETRWFRTRGAVDRFEGKPVSMAGVLTDITPQKKIQNELVEKTHFLDSIVSLGISGMYLFDLVENNNIYVNPIYTKITGYNLQELAEVPDFMALFHPDDIENIFTHINHVRKLEESDEYHEIEYRFRRKDGRWAWLKSKDSVFEFDSSGKPIKMLGSFIDISSLKFKEVELKRLANDFSSIFNQVAVGLCQVSLEGGFLIVNEKLCNILGFTKKELKGKDFQSITHKEDLTKDLEKVKSLIDGSSSNYSLEKRYITKIGNVIWALLTVSIVRDENNQPLHFISVIEDITYRKYTEDKLEESNKALDHFAYTASHDLQEPLRKITAFSGRLKETLKELDLGSEANFELDRIVYSSNRMSNMIKSLLDLSRYETKEIERKNTYFQSFIDFFISEYNDIILESKVDLKLEFDNKLKVFVDKTLFQIVVNNLMQNAIKYRDYNRDLSIKISVEENKFSQRVIFEDNGIGFTPTPENDILMPFKRMVGKDREGIGMGLASCDKIIRKHNGKIFMSSTLGKGATFIVELPKYPPEEE